MRDDFVAHTPSPGGSWHSLRSHLLGARERAARYGAPFGASVLAGWAALCHDIGKGHPEWQGYLRLVHERGLDRRAARALPRPRHPKAGAFLALEHRLPFIAAGILGHHSGMPARPDLKALRVGGKDDPEVTRALAHLQAWLPEALKGPSERDIPEWARNDKRSLEMFGRFVFSCVVDADWLDTENHFQGPRPPATPFDAAGLLKRLEDHRTALPRSPPTVQGARDEVYRACLAAGRAPQGFFRLSAPTGTGKTLGALAFALTHAQTHHLDRIVVALPYTTIIDQTADVYRRAFHSIEAEGPIVVEHHSAFDGEDPAGRLKLASENWDAPIVVTTTVQLFESMFSNRPRQCRKLHNLARSIVVLDEVQTLPVPLLEPTVDGLRQLVDHYGASVLLSTATQPALEGSSPYLQGIPQGSVREVLPDARRMAQELRRVDYEYRPDPVPWARLAEELRGLGCVLVVLNTRRHALELIDALDDPAALHLSTWLCGAHRRAILEVVRGRLAGEQPCRLISTQVVEAGVDLDFPAVYRAVGPLDRIVQAGGRCNRNGVSNRGRVVVFAPEDDAMPRGPYATATAEARRILARSGTDLHDPGTYEEYFRAVYQSTRTDGKGIQALREAHDYPAVAAGYKLIEADTEAVVVPYGEAHRVLEEVEASHVPALRELQPFTVQLYQNEVARLRRAGLVRERDSGILEWSGKYDERLGVGRMTPDSAAMIVG